MAPGPVAPVEPREVTYTFGATHCIRQDRGKRGAVLATYERRTDVFGNLTLTFSDGVSYPTRLDALCAAKSADRSFEGLSC